MFPVLVILVVLFLLGTVVFLKRGKMLTPSIRTRLSASSKEILRLSLLIQRGIEDAAPEELELPNRINRARCEFEKKPETTTLDNLTKNILMFKQADKTRFSGLSELIEQFLAERQRFLIFTRELEKRKQKIGPWGR
ncbi:hypothetical protein J7K18_05855 [bacterium]|nr:hypothetical protein [bacterium]